MRTAMAIAMVCVPVCAAHTETTLLGVVSDTGSLYEIDAETGTPKLLSTVNDPSDISSDYLQNMASLEFAPDGTLYTWTQGLGALYEIDPGTGIATKIGSLNHGDTHLLYIEGGLAFAPDGTAWGVGIGGGGANSLFTIDLGTGHVTEQTDIGDSFYDFNGIGFDAHGTLFGLRRPNAGTMQLVQIDLHTGAQSFVTTLPTVLPGVSGGMAVDGTDAYFVTGVTNPVAAGDNSLYRIELYTTAFQLVRTYDDTVPESADLGFTGLAVVPDIDDCQDPCPGDANGDCAVDAADINNILGTFATDDPDADLNNDGIVDSADLNEVLGYFGESCAP